MKTKENKNHNRNKNRTNITGMYSTSYPHIEHVKQCTPVQEKKTENETLSSSPGSVTEPAVSTVTALTEGVEIRGKGICRSVL